MDSFHDMLLAVWREACRHIEIAESTTTIAAILAERIPLESIIVRSLDLARSCLETIASQSADGQPHLSPARTELSSGQTKTLLTWASTGGLARRSTHDADDIVAMAAPSGLDGDILIGPLQGPGGPAGVLVLVAPKSTPLEDHHVHLATALLEPFGAALENDRRLREMQVLREAAEAERRTLLSKLGRKDVTTRVVGSDGGLHLVMERVAMVAPSDVPVLLFGETGTGKEVIAREIHTHSPRAPGPFIRVNCGAIPSELIDSQLFGHERGSFTGATDTRKGWFERADGGTLFLDEIGDLPLAAQVRLLRVLQDGCLERVGGQRLIHVDVRVVGATHRDLAELVRSGAFREDLWYRLAVFPVSIPPLRERAEDIGPLACHFAEKAATRFGLPLIIPTVDDIRLLTSYAWPGNVRELQAVIDRAALLGNGRRLEVTTALGAAPSPRSAAVSTTSAAATASGHQPATDTPSGETQDSERLYSLDEVARRQIEHALRVSHGRVEGLFGAATRLNIHPSTLRARMRRLSIDWRKFRPSGH